MNKYLISADIEGITGVIGRIFANENGSHYHLARYYMVSDINAVVEGILSIDGDAKIIVRDAHGVNAANIDLSQLHPKASLIQGWTSVQNMLTGLEDDFSGVFLVGFHAGGHNLDGVLGHTMHSIIRHIKINDRVLNEAGIFALYAGHYGVPIVFVSGDDHTIIEARDQLGDLVGVEVKKSYGRGCAESLSLSQAGELLRDSAVQAVKGLFNKKFSPFKLGAPFKLELQFYDIGYKVSVFKKLTDILAFNKEYHFNIDSRTLTFEDDKILVLLQKLNMIFHLIYGIQSSS